MFRRIIMSTLSSILITSSTSIVVACNTDLTPKILFVTSFKSAQNNPSFDQMIFHALQAIYGKQAVVTVFSNFDDNRYASILQNLIPKFQISKVFINNNSFNQFLPSQKQAEFDNTNLIRIIQQFGETNFYFFNGYFSDELKAKAPNIFELRFNQPTAITPNPTNYGEQVAKNFYQQIVTKGTDLVNNRRYRFKIVGPPGKGKYQIKIGYITNISNPYQQILLNQFLANLKTPSNAVYEINKVVLSQPSLTYDDNTWSVVESSVYKLYYNNNVNFVLNTNDWYNDAVAFAASKAKSDRKTKDTLKFIISNISNSHLFDYNNQNDLLFAYYADFQTIIRKTKQGLANDDLVANSTAEQNINSYGVNGALNFVNNSQD